MRSPHANPQRGGVRRRWMLAATALLALAAFSCGGREPAPPAGGENGALRVLFLGNSFTYYHNLPRMVEEFAAAAGTKIQTRMIAPDGASLADHLANKRVLEAIRSGQWDFVVLQEQSRLGAVYLVNGEYRVANPAAFFAAARALEAEIRKAGGKTVLLHTWPRREAPDSDRAMLDYAYMRMGRKLGATVAPVGIAWQQARAELPGADLYAPDGGHPSRSGSYLAAAVICAALTGANPVGGPARITGAPVDTDSGAVATGNVEVLAELPSRFAGELQSIAWQAHEKLAAAGGTLDLPAPPRPQPPPMPAGGRRPAPADLSGRWLGTLRLYPHEAILELWLAEKEGRPGEWSAALEARFPAGTLERITHELEQFEVTDTGVSFVDPMGPNGGTVRYRAVFLTGRGGGQRLAGVAEATVEGAAVYAIGTFELKRIQ